MRMKKDFIVRRSIIMVEGKPFVETYSEQELIRCKDCKNRFDGCCYNRKSDRTNFGVFVADDWFCGDGERRDDDA